MLKSVNGLAKGLRRSFSITKSYPALYGAFEKFKNSQDVSMSHQYQQMVNLLVFEANSQKRKSDILIDIQRMVLSENDFGIKLLKKYFESRKEVGYDEKILLTVLRNLGLYIQIMKNNQFTDDVLFSNLYSSEIFLSFMKDVRLCFTRNKVTNLYNIKHIFDSFRMLKYKDYELLEFIANKIYFDQFGEEYIEGTFERLERAEKIHIDELVMERIDDVLQSDKFKDFMDKILSAANFQPKRIQDIASVKDEQTKEFLSSLDSVKFGLQLYSKFFFKILDAISQLRSYYIRLQEEEKQAFIQQNPSLLLDFLEFEEQLITLGVIMPKDVLEKKESPEITEMVLEQFILENTSFADEFEQIFKSLNIDYYEDQTETYEELFEQTKYQRELDALKLLAALVEYTKIKTSCVDSEDNFNDSMFKEIVDPKNSEELQSYGKRLKTIMEENYRYIDISNLKLAEYYYGKPFTFIREFIQNYLDRYEIKENDFKLNLYKYILQEKIIMGKPDSALKNMILTGEMNEDRISELINNIKELDFDFLSKAFEMNKSNAFLGYLEEKVSNISIKTGFRLVVLQLLIFLKSDPKYNVNKETVDSIIKKFLCNENFDFFLNSYRKFLVPVNEDSRKALLILNYCLIEYNDYLKKNDLLETCKNTITFIRNNMEMDWELHKHRDPIYIQILEALSNHFNQKQHIAKACFSIKSSISSAFDPHFLFFNGDKLKAVYLLKTNKHEDKFSVQFNNSMIKLFYKNKFNIDIDIEYVEMRELFEDPEYFVTHNFELKKDGENILKKFEISNQSVLKTFELSLNAMLDGVELEGRVKGTFEELRVLLQRTLRVSENYSLVSQKGHQASLVQLSFILDLISNLITDKDIKERLTALRQELQAIQRQNNTDVVEEGPLSGVRLGITGNRENGYFSKAELQLLNYSLFQKSNYFLISSWESELRKNLNQLDYNEDEDNYTDTNFTTIQNCLIPNINGRRVATNSKFDLYWDYEAMGDQEESELGKQLNDVLKRESDSKINDVNRKRLSLLNLLYEFRTIENFDSFFKELLKLPFLDIYMEKADSDELPVGKGLYSNDDLIEFASSSHPVIDDYQKRIEGFKDIKKKITLYQELIKETLPLEYAKAKDSHTKELLYNFSKKAKADYISLLNQYNREFVERDQLFTGYEYKDMNNELIYDESEPLKQREMEDRPDYDLRAACINSVIKLRLLRQNQDNTLANTYRQRYADGSFLVKRELSFLSFDTTLGSVFTETDFAFFDTYLPHNQLREVKDLSLNDLLITLGMMIDSKSVNLLEMERYLNEHYQDKDKLDSEAKKSILDLFTTQVNNSIRFSHDFARRSIQHKTKQVKDKDLESFENVFGIQRSKLIRQKEERLILV